jgi:hypothetical protein
MKVSPVPSLGTTVAGVDAQAARVESIRSMRMSTNATPGQIVPETTEELSISDANKEPNPVVEDTQPISPQFAALAKQRRALQQEKRAFEDAKKAFEATKSQGSDSVPMSRLKSEPLKVLLESGVTYDQLTEAILANQGNPELNALKAEIAALKEGVDKKFSESELQEREQLFKEVARDAQSIIASRLDDFELIQKMDRVPVAVEIWKKEFEETGAYPDIEGILKDVEEHCLQECQEFSKLKKIQNLFKQPEVPAQQRPQGMRTLTNKDTASVPMSAKARALAAFHGTLKK